MDPLGFNSEDLLVTTLDKYVAKNKVGISGVIVKLNLAIESIRILLVKDEIINACTNEHLKIILFKRKRKFLHAPNIDFEKRIMGLHRNKPSLLYCLPLNIQEKLYELYNSSFCICCYQGHSSMECLEFKKQHNYPDFKSMFYRKYYTQLRNYSDENLKLILDAFKKADSRMFYGLADYDLYLES